MKKLRQCPVNKRMIGSFKIIGSAVVEKINRAGGLQRAMNMTAEKNRDKQEEFVNEFHYVKAYP